MNSKLRNLWLVIVGAAITTSAAFAQTGPAIDFSDAGTAVKTEIVSNITTMMPVLGGILMVAIGVPFAIKLLKRLAR